jgi:hypothetical protein
MHAAHIASHGRVAHASSLSIASQGKLYKSVWVEVVISAIATYIARARSFVFNTRSRPCYVE